MDWRVIGRMCGAPGSAGHLWLSCSRYRVGVCRSAARWLPSLPPRARAAVGKEVVEKYYREEAEKILAPVTKFLLRHGIDAKSEWKIGHAGESIAKFADTGKFDLVIMGSHGHGALVNLVTGSVATQVLAQCKVPVLLIRDKSAYK